MWSSCALKKKKKGEARRGTLAPEKGEGGKSIENGANRSAFKKNENRARKNARCPG